MLQKLIKYFNVSGVLISRKLERIVLTNNMNNEPLNYLVYTAGQKNGYHDFFINIIIVKKYMKLRFF